MAAAVACHCPGDIVVRIRKVLAGPWVGVRVCHLLIVFFFWEKGGYNEIRVHFEGSLGIHK